MAVANPLLHTKEQMVAKVITLVEMLGLFPTAVLEWNAVIPANKIWQEIKAHFGQACQLLIITGAQGQNLLQGRYGSKCNDDASTPRQGSGG